MNISITKLRDGAQLPEYQTEHSAAMDLHACLEEPVTLRPLQRLAVPTGFAMALPPGYEAQVRARSGLSIKHGIAMVNGIGTIDADYRGEVGALVINLGEEDFTIEPGMRIAQLVVARHETVSWQLVDELDKTARGEGGYGSTGR